MEFGKKDTLALKGIAIIAMMFHHCFLAASRFKGYDISFFPLTVNQGVAVAEALKICVPIFAFVSGYGLWKSYAGKKTSAGRWMFQRYLKTFSGYWMVFILVFIVGMILNRRPLTTYFDNTSVPRGLTNIALNFLGLDSFFGTDSMAGAWWYMGLALLIILLLPFVFHISEKIGTLPTCIIVLIMPMALCLETPGGVKPLSFVGAAAFGMYMADLGTRKNLLTIGDRTIVTRILTFVVGIGFVGLYFVLFHSLKKDPYWVLMYDVMPIPVIWFCLKYIVKIPGLRIVLQFLGKHSMNIFLVHAFLRTDVHLRPYLFGCRYSLLVVLAILVLSLPFSFAIEGLKKLTRWDSLFDRLGRVGMKDEQ